ncbi:MAG: ABC transporter ATP-binding protein [Planctomycetota bacterium]|nr:ABC transporter ATP-binding protein [Planctomycetota bacterium]
MTTGNGAPILELERVVKAYPAPEGGAPVAVLKEVTLTLNGGESVAIVGPSGSGKSTLLQIVGTLDRASSGRVLLAGRDLAALSEDERARLRNREIGFVFQAHHLLPQCTVLENVLVPTLAEGPGPDAQAEARARDLLERVGLGARLNHRPGQLSGGERQRVAVVRALINQPKLLLADEPTGSLDRATAEGLTDLLADLNRETGVTLIVVTHSAGLAERMGRVLELQDGKLVEK